MTLGPFLFLKPLPDITEIYTEEEREINRFVKMER